MAAKKCDKMCEDMKRYEVSADVRMEFDAADREDAERQAREVFDLEEGDTVNITSVREVPAGIKTWRLAFMKFLDEQTKYALKDIDFKELDDVKIEWEVHHGKEMVVHVPDYLKGASQEVADDMAQVLIRVIGGQRENIVYSDATVRYLTSQEFYEANKEKWMDRHERMWCDKDCYELSEAYERLVREGYVERNDDLTFKWHGDRHKFGRASVLFKTVSLSDVFDPADCPNIRYAREMLDAALLYYIAKAECPFGASDAKCEKMIEERCSKHPHYTEFRCSAEALGMFRDVRL